MMKKSHRFLAVMTVIVMIVSCFIVFPSAEKVTIKYGDVNNDNYITASDALLALQQAVNKITLDEKAYESARVTQGEKVTASDALLILQAAVGKITPSGFASGETGEFGDDDLPDTPPVSAFASVQKEDYWSYSTLSLSQKDIYNTISNAVSSRTVSEVVLCYDGKYQPEDVRMAYYAVQKDNPDYFYMPLSYNLYVQGGKLSFRVGQSDTSDYYIYTADEVNAITPQLETRIQEILTTVVSPEMSQYEIALSLHDWLTQNAQYHHEAAASPEKYPKAWSVANVLLGEKRGVCEAFSRAYQLLLYRCGINCTLVSGTSEGVPHMWNIIELDGEWYEVDITMDITPIGIEPAHVFFNQTTEAFGHSHVRAENISDSDDIMSLRYFNYDLPIADSEELNYYKLNGAYYESVEQFSANAPATIAKAADDGKNSYEIMIRDVHLSDPNEAFDYITVSFVTSVNSLITNKEYLISSYSASLISNAPAFKMSWN